MSRKLSLATYQERGRMIYPGGEITYRGLRYVEGVLMLEAICHAGHEFNQYAANQPKGRGCPICPSTPKWTLPAFSAAALPVHGPGFSYQALEVVGTNTSIRYLCPQGHECRQVLHDHLKGMGCATCAAAGRELTLDEWLPIFREKHGDTYQYLRLAPRRLNCGIKSREVVATCPQHGKIILNADRHAKGVGCRQCARVKVGAMTKLSAEDFYAKSTKKHAGRYTYGTDYTGTMQPFTVICPDHGEFVQRAATHAYEGKGCPLCFGRITGPNLEIQAFLSKLGMESLLEQKIPGTRKSMDLLVAQVGIEYHGNIWHSMAWQRSIDSHKERLNLATAAGIRLIQLFSDEWTYRRQACQLLLQRAVGAPEVAINARACVIVDLPHKVASAFLDAWHVQGATSPNTTYMGLEAESQLVAVMGFSFNTSKRSEKVSANKVELVRFATCKNVRGGFSRLLTAWLRQHPGVQQVVSYSDDRLFLGRMYESCGFMRDGQTRIDYTYLDQRTDRRLHKSNFQKSKLKKLMGEAYDDTKTELQLTESLKLYRVYDCGKTRWVMTIIDDKKS